MSSRPAPPGRRGSVKKGSFKGDQLADAIDPTSAAARRLREQNQAAEEEATEKVAKAAADKAATEQAATKASAAAAEKARTERIEREIAENNAAKKDAAERAAVEAARTQAVAEKLAAQKAVAEQEAAQVAVAEELAAQKALEAAQTLRSLEIKRREEEERSVQEAAEVLEKRRQDEAAEATRQQMLQEQRTTELQQQQAQLEEQQRRMDEKRRLQKEREATEAATALQAAAEAAAQQEAAAASIREAEANADAERTRKAADFAAKLEAEEVERKRVFEEEQARLKAEQAAEWARLEAERQAALEEAKAAEQAMAEFEDAELIEKRKRAEAQKKKREMFLSDMDSFSVDFVSKTRVQEDELKDQAEKHKRELDEQQSKVEQLKAATAAKAIAEQEAAAAAAVAAQLEAEQAAAERAREKAIGSSMTAPSATGEQADGVEDSGVIALDIAAAQDLNTALFDKEAFAVVGGQKADAEAAVPGSSDDLSTFKVPTRIGRVSSKAATTVSAATDSSTAAISSTEQEQQSAKRSIVVTQEDMERAAAAAAVLQHRSMPATTTSSSVTSSRSISPVPTMHSQQPRVGATQRPVNEDDEEEGTGVSSSISNILTMEERRAMTEAQKASWRAKQADLTTHRKDFHGVVTYAYEGIFSWQMYGSAEAVDETGTSYTEYLMRCQWGTAFENMQPWIVAHRFKEFDALDQKIRRQFPHMETNMPKLPKKEMFRSLDASVVAKRRAALEYYMSRVIGSMPTIVRSSLFVSFLNVKERTAAIILQLSRANIGGATGAGTTATDVSSASVAAASDFSNPLGGDVRSSSNIGGGSISPKASSTAVQGNSKYGIEDPLAVRRNAPSSRSQPQLPNRVMLQETNAAEDMKLEDSGDAPYWSVEEAETAKEALNASSLDEDQLGWLELDIKALGTLLRTLTPTALLDGSSKFRSTFTSISCRWPQLRATAVVGMGVDFTLIPRAMQAEEDLLRHLNEFRSMETAQKMATR